MSSDHITVCVCTYRRPEWLRRLLQALEQQKAQNLFAYSIVVADNDSAESARPVVAEFTSKAASAFKYCVEPRKNIAHVRNRAVQNASGNWIAFIDDDEFPGSEWLLHLYQTASRFNVAGVLGPVLPHFETDPPSWVKAGKFYERPRHTTGFELDWAECRTGNVLFRRSLIDADPEPFRPEFGTGGEDQDFFRRMIGLGHRFVWCDEAPVWETVPPERWDKKIMISRALLRGKNTFRHKQNRIRNLGKSAVALPCYMVALPFLLVLGRHHYVRYLIKAADHFGRILELLRLNPVRERLG